MTFSHGEAEQLLGNPDTDASTLSEIATAFPDLRARVLAHENVYQGLVDWIVEFTPPAVLSPLVQSAGAGAATPTAPGQSFGAWVANQFVQHRMRSVAILAGCAVLLTGLGVGTAVAVASSFSPEPVVAAAPTPSARPTKTATPSATPVAPAELFLSESQMGVPFGSTVLVGEKYTVGPSVEGPVTLYFPGKQTKIFDAELLFAAEDIVSQKVTLTGPDLESVVMLVKIREPASGLDPERYHYDLVLLDQMGTVLARNVVQDNVEDGTQSWVLVGSATNTVAVSMYFGNGSTTRGINALTGTEVWSSQEYMSEMTFGTLLVDASSAERDRVDRACRILSGFDIASGQKLWTIDSTATRTPKGYCTSLTVEYGPRYEFGVPEGIVVVSYQDDGPYVKVTSARGFNVSTGAELVVAPVGTFDEVDPLTGYVVTLIEDGGLRVYDSATGETVYAVDEQRRIDLNLRITGLYGGLLHTTTTDGAPVVDVVSGEVVADDIGFTPLGAVGEWTLYSDGVLSKDPARIS